MSVTAERTAVRLTGEPVTVASRPAARAPVRPPATPGLTTSRTGELGTSAPSVAEPALTRLRRHARTRDAGAGRHGPELGGIGTVRRMLATSEPPTGIAGEPIKAQWKESSVSSTEKEHLTDEQQQLDDAAAIGPVQKEEALAANRRAQAGRMAGLAGSASTQVVTHVRSDADESHTVSTHWVLAIGFGDPLHPQWLQIDLTRGEHRLIWHATPKGTDRPFAGAGSLTVGDVLQKARQVGAATTTYRNPVGTTDAEIEAQGVARYSCQHFVAKVLAELGVRQAVPRKEQ